MIWALIAIAINRDIQGEPAYIRCARCGAISDTPTRTLSTMTWRPGRPPEHTTTPPEWTCPSCGREGPLEVGEQLPSDSLTRGRRTLICRYTWNVPRDATTVTCPRCETRQPAAHING
jgi:Zn finger protein HypA/HybF involved in hydrogenase expression